MISGTRHLCISLKRLAQFKEITPTDDGKVKAVITVGSAWHDKDHTEVYQLMDQMMVGPPQRNSTLLRSDQ